MEIMLLVVGVVVAAAALVLLVVPIAVVEKRTIHYIRLAEKTH
jgi:hypothetical protein